MGFHFSQARTAFLRMYKNGPSELFGESLVLAVLRLLSGFLVSRFVYQVHSHNHSVQMSKAKAKQWEPVTSAGCESMFYFNGIAFALVSPPLDLLAEKQESSICFSFLPFFPPNYILARPLFLPFPF